jgi:hypothetical protein
MDFLFRLYGRVRVAGTNEPVVGVVVRGWDKDLIFDDVLGEAVTDADGRFEIRYTDEAFRSVLDQRPDIYVQVWDGAGDRQLFTSESSVRWNAGSEEEFDISLPPEALASE